MVGWADSIRLKFRRSGTWSNVQKMLVYDREGQLCHFIKVVVCNMVKCTKNVSGQCALGWTNYVIL